MESGHEHWTARVRGALASIGLNVVTSVDGSDYGGVLPGCRSVLVFASGGPFLWEAFLEDLRRNPAYLRESEHPLDDFVKRRIAAADPENPGSRRWIRCAAQPEAFVDFRPLGVRGTIGWRSRLGLVLHPTYGPWIALRAACFTTEALQLDERLPDPGPCAECSAPCITACPGGALASGQMDIQRCSRFHLESSVCAEKCDARRACPQGEAFRYSALEQQYHYSRRSGRRQLAHTLGIADDSLAGRDPNWAAWAHTRPV
jgi:hypothetical protein